MHLFTTVNMIHQKRGNIGVAQTFEHHCRFKVGHPLQIHSKRQR